MWNTFNPHTNICQTTNQNHVISWGVESDTMDACAPMLLRLHACQGMRMQLQSACKSIERATPMHMQLYARAGVCLQHQRASNAHAHVTPPMSAHVHASDCACNTEAHAMAIRMHFSACPASACIKNAPALLVHMQHQLACNTMHDGYAH